jgi:cullin-4
MSHPQSSAHNIAIATSSMPPENSRIPNHNTADQTKSCSTAGGNRRSSTFPEPAAKRLKTAPSAGNINRPADMNKGKRVIGMRGFVDLTRQSQFQPHTGAKRLVIKNLRVSNGKAADEYYDKVWGELDDALTSVCVLF